MLSYLNVSFSLNRHKRIQENTSGALTLVLHLVLCLEVLALVWRIPCVNPEK